MFENFYAVHNLHAARQKRKGKRRGRVRIGVEGEIQACFERRGGAALRGHAADTAARAVISRTLS